MRSLFTGQDAVLSWGDGSMQCRIVAAAGRYVLVRPERDDPFSRPEGAASLTYLDGAVPMGFDGDVQPSSESGEWRFRIGDLDREADRRTSARVDVDGPVTALVGGELIEGRLLDVSAGGMRFRNPRRIGPGTTIGVRAELPGGMVVDADALVTASEPGVTSVHFVALHGETDVQAIGRWTVEALRRMLTA